MKILQRDCTVRFLLRGWCPCDRLASSAWDVTEVRGRENIIHKKKRKNIHNGKHARNQRNRDEREEKHECVCVCIFVHACLPHARVHRTAWTNSSATRCDSRSCGICGGPRTLLQNLLHHCKKLLQESQTQTSAKMLVEHVLVFAVNLTRLFFLTRTNLFCCSVPREMFTRSSCEPTTPLTNFKHSAVSSTRCFVVRARRTNSWTLLRLFLVSNTLKPAQWDTNNTRN